MTGRERVKAALTFSHPDRAPRDLWALPYVSRVRRCDLDALLNAFPVDIGHVSGGAGTDDRPAVLAGTYTDAWGSVWYVTEPGMIGQVRRPALDDWSHLATFQPPWDALRERDLSHVDRACEASDRFMLSDVTARPFERLQSLRGVADLFVDLAYGTAEVRRLLEMVHAYYLEDVRAWCRTNVDGIFMMDDWGGARSLLIRPEMWRELFKPLYAEYCDVIHAASKFAFFHTDGYIEPIFGDLIEAGFDAINAQLSVMDVEGLACRYKGKVTFWGEVDRQQTLPCGTPEDVRAEVMRIRRALDDGTGGVIAQCELGRDTPRENVEAAFRAWLEPCPVR